MTEAEQSEMQRLREELGMTFCRRCDYCQPCTAEIPISTVMTLPSFLKRAPPQWVFSGILADAVEKAANCTECGDCEERCPYHLPIIAMIAEHVRQYEIEKKKYQEEMPLR